MFYSVPSGPLWHKKRGLGHRDAEFTEGRRVFFIEELKDESLKLKEVLNIPFSAPQRLCVR
jgi:hypothetical protein